MRLFKYYYGICEHQLCVQIVNNFNHKETGVLSKDGLLYLKVRDDEYAKKLFVAYETQKVKSCGNPKLVAKHKKRIKNIVDNPIVVMNL